MQRDDSNVFIGAIADCTLSHEHPRNANCAKRNQYGAGCAANVYEDGHSHHFTNFHADEDASTYADTNINPRTGIGYATGGNIDP